MTRFTRSYPLDDISIRSGGDGRTVEAYAAVFNTPTDITDHQGTYSEVISPAAFERTIAHKGSKFGVFYNHGLTIHGTPSERGSMPIGTPVEVRGDDRGLWTITRYNKTPLADEALEAIRTGAITGQSFSGRFIGSDPKTPRGGFKPDADGGLPTVTRTEIALSEYGPTPFPAYSQAAIVGVRNVAGCTCGRGTTIELEVNVDGGGEPTTDGLCDCACPCCADCTCPDPSATTPDGAPGRSAITAPGDPDWDSARRTIHWSNIKLAMREKGVL